MARFNWATEGVNWDMEGMMRGYGAKGKGIERFQSPVLLRQASEAFDETIDELEFEFNLQMRE
jgi:hypothetical protein